MNIDRINRQDREPSIRRASAMLKGVKAPEKTESEWSVLESGLLGRLGSFDHETASHRSHFPFFFPKPVALASGFAVAAAIAFISIAHVRDAKSDPYARFLSIRGKVCAGPSDSKQPDTLKGIQGGVLLKKGLRITTLDNGSCIIRIDKGTALEASPRSRLTFDAFSQKRIIINLTRGSILAKVSKRTKDQKFMIITPSASCAVVGTNFRVNVNACGSDTSSTTELTVYEGKVAIAKGSALSGNVQYVATGQECRASPRSIGTIHAIDESETPLKNISTLRLLVGPESDGPVKSGIIDVSSRPEGALVMIDDTMAGATPLLLRKPVGNHSLVMSASGFASWESSISVGQDSVSSLSACLLKSESDARSRPVLKPSRVPLIKSVPESTLVALPDYVEAMIQLTIGEYQKSLGILETIEDKQPIDVKSRMNIMKKINGCYAQIGDFSHALEHLRGKFITASTADEKERYLWEMSNMQANCMGDYKGAQRSLTELLAVNPFGKRAMDAYGKLAEVYYMQGKYDSAAATYKTLLQKFPSGPDRDKALFSRACILEEDFHDYKNAIELYSRVIDSFPRSVFFNAALFQRGESAAKLGRLIEAAKDYKKYLAADPQGLWSSVSAGRLRAIK